MPLELCGHFLNESKQLSWAREGLGNLIASVGTAEEGLIELETNWRLCAGGKSGKELLTKVSSLSVVPVSQLNLIREYRFDPKPSFPSFAHIPLFLTYLASMTSVCFLEPIHEILWTGSFKKQQDALHECSTSSAWLSHILRHLKAIRKTYFQHDRTDYSRDSEQVVKTAGICFHEDQSKW